MRTIMSDLAFIYHWSYNDMLDMEFKELLAFHELALEHFKKTPRVF